MKTPKLLSRWLILALITVSMAAVLALGFTQAAFNDIETSQSNAASAWTSANWTQTKQSDFSAGNLSNVDTSTSPGDVILLLASGNSTKSPTTNNTGSWSGAANAYADGGSAANITSGNPSGSTIWGNYGFSFAGNVTSLRIQYDAWSINNSLVTTVNTSPTGNDANTGSFTFTGGTSLWGSVADTSTTTYVTGATNGGGYCTFTFTPFAVPAGSTNISLHVAFLFRSATTTNTNNGAAEIKVGGNYYRSSTNTPNKSSGAILTVQKDWTTNPNTGAAWTVDEINGTDATNPFEAFGVGGIDFNPDVNFYECKAWVTYNAADDEQINIDVSWDGGTSWSSVQTTDLTGTQTAYWYDVTGATNWTSAKLANGQFQVRLRAQTVGDPGTVYLDWLPVEVIYDSYPSTGTVASQVFNTNVTASRWDGLFWDTTLLSGTNIIVSVRASDTSFLKTDSTPSWTVIGANSPVITGLPQGRYKQWRAVLNTTDSLQTPALNEVRLYYYGHQ